ncbi:MAG TPA: pentapeptide repeat-containing protein [Roseiflexaceae bacterium]|nr:pentapeptide repeat-containing protein [Roseiflexaceae bacterium]
MNKNTSQILSVLSGIFIGVDFSAADLRGARLCGEFTGVDFSAADLRGATISGCFLDVDFTGAIMPNGQIYIDMDAAMLRDQVIAPVISW